MIGYIKGKLLHYDQNVVLLENNGIGYEINCSTTVLDKLIAGNGGEVYTYMAVREDGVSLYGFSNLNEKNMFLELISVSGVGPKMGITILGSINYTDLAVKIATADVKGLSAIKGLGKKTAERIIVELREKMGAVSSDEFTLGAPIEKQKVKANQDAVIALMSLGWTKAECEKAVISAQETGLSEIDKIIGYAIKNMQ